MRRREMLRTTSAAVLSSAFSYAWTNAAEQSRKRVLYFTRNLGYYHSVVQRRDGTLSHSERALIDMGKRIGVEIICSKDGRVFDHDLDQYDAIAFYTNNDLTKPGEYGEPPMSMAGKRRLQDAVAAGTGFIGFHSSCASWRTPGELVANSEEVDPYIDMIGGEFVAHGPQQQATMRVCSPRFPGMEGLTDSFRLMEEWYALKNFNQDLHVILAQETSDMRGECYQRPSYPSTWARMHGKGRVFFTAMGHRENVWVESPFQPIVLGALSWVLGRVDVDVTPNIDQVTPDARRLSNG